MSGSACSWATCGNCGMCSSRYDAHPDGYPTCDHPEHWRKPESDRVDSGSCRLCGALASTIEREQAQKCGDGGR